ASIWAALAVLRRYPFVEVLLNIDGKWLARRTPFVFVGNNRYEMQGFRIGARARLDRGELSLYVANRTGRLGLVRLALRALFRRTDDALLTPLASVIAKLAPHLVAVSGDLTQRARTTEFQAARAFLDRLPEPQIVVPGNHDVPLHNVFTRFIGPLDKYRRYITGDVEPFYADDEIAVLGINTARSLTFKRGRINSTQIDRAKTRLCALDPKIIKIIVTHHPFDF